MSITYKQAGVDIEKGDLLVERIKQKVKSTYGKRVVAGVGGFACLYEVGDRYLAAGTDGVGTKLKLAQTLNQHNTIGIDLVAMCINDIICTGAKPLFFMDYLACGALDLPTSEAIIDGIVDACKASDCALIGGETAEMPGMYPNGEYDLAGFGVGEVDKAQVIDGSQIQAGQTLIGLPSSGFHSNGFSLIRSLIEPTETDLMQACLTPTKLYWQAVKPILPYLTGMAHITGGGFDNIARLNNNLDYCIENQDFTHHLPDFMATLINRSQLNHEELFKTFNMGIGMVLITDQPKQVIACLDQAGETYYPLGKVTEGAGKVCFG